jgi:hypothetical protein
LDVSFVTEGSPKSQWYVKLPLEIVLELVNVKLLAQEFPLGVNPATGEGYKTTFFVNVVVHPVTEVIVTE